MNREDSERLLRGLYLLQDLLNAFDPKEEIFAASDAQHLLDVVDREILKPIEVKRRVV